jgi:hypothetical protein
MAERYDGDCCIKILWLFTQHLCMYVQHKLQGLVVSVEFLIFGCDLDSELTKISNRHNLVCIKKEIMMYL